MGEGEGQQGAPQVGVILLGRLLQVGLPPSISAGGGRKKEGEKGKEEAESPPLSFIFPSFLLLLGRPIWGAHQPLVGWCVPLLGPLSSYLCRGLPGTPSGDPVSPKTLPVFEYHRPIYEYLPLNYFETPRHVRDLIRDS